MDTNRFEKDIIKEFLEARYGGTRSEDYKVGLKYLDHYLENKTTNKLAAFFLSESDSELIEEGIYLREDTEEVDPQYLYSVNTGDVNRPDLYTLSEKTGKFRKFVLTEDLYAIKAKEGYSIMANRIGANNILPTMSPTLGDIFLHGNYVKEVGTKKFKVVAKTTTYSHVEVEATDNTDAWLKAEKMDGANFQPSEGEGAFEIVEVTEL